MVDNNELAIINIVFTSKSVKTMTTQITIRLHRLKSVSRGFCTGNNIGLLL